ncbi:MAG: TnsA endonuclease N-terminal domain-containing protein, partial [Aquincola sp.]|nr:TnsA endonuclease N-terminal domain-containing protein [Aquincola sp.]
MVAVLLPRLRRIVHQPFRLELPCAEDGASEVTYVPDFSLEFESGKRGVVEVKPEKFLPKHRAKLAAAAEALRAQGQTFFVVTDKDLRSTLSMPDAVQIRRIAKMQCSDEEVERTLAVLSDSPGFLTAGELSTRAGVGLHVVAWLVSRARIGTKGPGIVKDATLVIDLAK